MEGGAEGNFVSGGLRGGGFEKRGTGNCRRHTLAAKKSRRKVNKRRLYRHWANASATVSSALALEMHKEGAWSV